MGVPKEQAWEGPQRQQQQEAVTTLRMEGTVGDHRATEASQRGGVHQQIQSWKDMSHPDKPK